MSKWKANSRVSRYAGISILLGGALFVTATLMHPPATDPWTGHHVISMIPDMLTYWQWDHSLMLAQYYYGLEDCLSGRSWPVDARSR